MLFHLSDDPLLIITFIIIITTLGVYCQFCLVTNGRTGCACRCSNYINCCNRVRRNDGIREGMFSLERRETNNHRTTTNIDKNIAPISTAKFISPSNNINNTNNNIPNIKNKISNNININYDINNTSYIYNDINNLSHINSNYINNDISHSNNNTHDINYIKNIIPNDDINSGNNINLNNNIKY